MSNGDLKWLVLVGFWTSCAPQVPANYARLEAAAQAATARRDHATAATEWSKAAQLADNETDRQEALYRQATSALRGGDASQHRQVLERLARSPGARQERAAYDLAVADFTQDTSTGRASLRAVLVKYPASGLARGALDRWMGSLTPAQRVEAIAELLPQVNEPALHERLLFLQAQALEATGDSAKALDVYQRQLSEYPYPLGRYWDEALLRQSVLWLLEGDLSRCIATLEKMLSFREQATIVGSYERRYADATLLLAYALLADRWQQAYTLLRDFPTRHPDSRNQDDALWAAVLLAHSHDQHENACRDAMALVNGLPDSRYAPCAHQYCPGAQASGSCKSYIASNRSTAQETLRLALTNILATPN